jgi:hypothetical protein
MISRQLIRISDKSLAGAKERSYGQQMFGSRSILRPYATIQTMISNPFSTDPYPVRQHGTAPRGRSHRFAPDLRRARETPANPRASTPFADRREFREMIEPLGLKLAMKITSIVARDLSECFRGASFQDIAGTNLDEWHIANRSALFYRVKHGSLFRQPRQK